MCHRIGLVLAVIMAGVLFFPGAWGYLRLLRLPTAGDPFGAGFEAMLFNGVLGAAGLAMILPMFVPSRWRARQLDDSDDSDGLLDGDYAPSPGVTRMEPVMTAPPTQLTPIRATSLAPLPAAPWHDAEEPRAPIGPSTL
jgi:hypothetical protein